MKSSIKIDFIEVDGKGLQPVIKIRQEDSDDPRDGLLKTFFQKLGGKSSWLSVSFDHFIEDMTTHQSRRFITISPVQADELAETMKLIQQRLKDPEVNNNYSEKPALTVFSQEQQ